MKKFFEKFLKKVLTFSDYCLIITLASDKDEQYITNYGVWLSLARAPDLGSGGRRFESCHPDFAGVVQW